ncbi:MULTISPECIES: MFS transporter [Halorussus]|uniref:MFS transporter n=1 Tax=Halorussus TaxID=1070314 RepID=UPI0019672C5D|nr:MULTISPECIES: MFS transporter [Halorussus]
MSTILGIGWATTQLGRQVLPPLLPTITQRLAITPSEAGLALTLMWGAYALVHYPGGRYSDELTRKTVLMAGLGVMVVGFAVLLTVFSYAPFLVGVTLVGIGAGLYFVPMRALLADLFVEQRGRALGINLAAGMAGSVLAAGLAIVALRVATWKAAFAPILVTMVVVAVSLQRRCRESYSLSWVDLELRESVRRVFGSWRIRQFVIAYSLWAFTFQAIINFLPTFLQANGFSSGLATMGFALFFVAATVVMPLAGNLGDDIGHVPVAVGGILLGVVGLIGMLLAPTVPTILLSIVVFSAGLMAYPPVMQAHLMDVFPTGDVGGDFGVFKTVYTAIGSLGPTYAGVVAERTGFAVAFGSTAGFLLLGAGFTIVVLNKGG